MKGEDISMCPACLLNDFRRGVLAAPKRTVQPINQWVELVGAQSVQASEIGDDAHAHLPAVVAEGLDQLQVLAVAGLGDARIHCVAKVSEYSPTNQQKIEQGV